WGDLSALPNGFDDGMMFFRRALEEKVICVPGEFFDVNPGRRRSGRASRYRCYVRFSFGPSYSVLEEGLSRLQRMIAS
ncbi:MAG: pyridoxal phosphate-dependent aminotransferase, partial [Myxococcota bacterium]